MRPNAWIATVFLTVMLAGCAQGPPAAPAADATSEPARPSTSDASQAGRPADLPSRLVSVDVRFDSPGSHYPGESGADADGIHREYSRLLILRNPEGAASTGNLLDWAREDVHADATRTLHGMFVFTGAIDPCGSGVMQLSYVGSAGRPEAPDGQVAGSAKLALIPGSASLGFAGVTKVDLVETFRMDPNTHAAVGNLKGAVACRPTADHQREDPSQAPQIPVDARFDTDGFAYVDAGGCDVSAAPSCWLASHQFWTVRGTWNGTVEDRPVSIDIAPDGSLTADIMRIFTGSIRGCGSGMFTTVGLASIGAPSTDNPGYFVTHEKWRLLAGSMSNGFAGLRGLDMDLTYDLMAAPYQGFVRDGKMAGNVWCQPGEDTTSHAHIAPVALKGRLTVVTTIGEQVQCDPYRPGWCTADGVQIGDFSGGITGLLLDHGYLSPNPDATLSGVFTRVVTGTVDGCGSGTFRTRFVYDHMGAAPNTADVAHVKEPPTHLILGATSVGLSRLADLEVHLEYGAAQLAPGIGIDYTATAWCAAG